MKIMYLSMLAVLLIGSVALSTSAKEISISNPLSHVNFFDNPSQVSLLPKLQQSDSFPLLSAQGVLAVDISSGVVLYEKDADKPLLPASTTKIVTALTALDLYKLDEEVIIPSGTVVGQKMGLVSGERISVKDLLYGLLIYSANDAAEVLASHHPEGRQAFIQAMNDKAKQLAMYDSLFVNPSGLEDIGHVSTARDLTRAALVSMNNPLIAQIVGTKNTQVTSTDGKIVHRLANTNELLGVVEGVLGVKTGWTENARENLVTFIERDGHKVAIALLGSQDRFGETKELIDWVFTNYQWQALEIPVYSTP